MPRIQFSDVTPPERRSIRDVPIPNSGKRKVPIVIKPTPKEVVSEVVEKKDSSVYEYYYPKNKKESEQFVSDDFNKSKRKQWVFGTIAIILIAIFIVSMMTVFASATITVIPKSESLEVDLKIVATNDTTENSIRYEVLKLSKTKTISVPATGEEAVEIKALGKIMIYNNFSFEPQRLIVRTRFESPEGLIYRIPESIVVPGKSLKNGVETPGSIEVEVFADEAGEKYNIKKTDFTIPGFKSDANRYKNLYARSVTEMTGGFVGKRKTVLATEKQAVLQNISSETEADLEKDLRLKVPEGLTLLSGSIVYESKELPLKDEGSSVALGKEVTAYAIMLNSQDLSNRIITEYVSGLPAWYNIKSEIKDFSLLNVMDKPKSLETGEKINLQIKGKTTVLASIDTNTINQRLSGAPKKEVAKLMIDLTGISSITAAIRPIWKQSFPKDPSKIRVEISQNK